MVVVYTLEACYARQSNPARGHLSTRGIRPTTRHELAQRTSLDELGNAVGRPDGGRKGRLLTVGDLLVELEVLCKELGDLGATREILDLPARRFRYPARVDLRRSAPTEVRDAQRSPGESEQSRRAVLLGRLAKRFHQVGQG